MSINKPKIALIAASGRTGVEVLTQALDKGHSVRALVRSPEKVKIKHENLEVVEADMHDLQSLTDGFKDCGVVMSCLGATSKTPRGTSLYLDTIKVIAEAMRMNGLTRLIVMSSWGTFSDPRSPFFIEHVMRRMIAAVLASMREMELYLQQQRSDLEFTVVRTGGLKNTGFSGKVMRVEEESPCVTQDGCIPTIMISRADVAAFLLETLDSGAYTRKAVAIGV